MIRPSGSFFGGQGAQSQISFVFQFFTRDAADDHLEALTMEPRWLILMQNDERKGDGSMFWKTVNLRLEKGSVVDRYGRSLPFWSL